MCVQVEEVCGSGSCTNVWLQGDEQYLLELVDTGAG